MTERTLDDVVNDLRKQFGERILMHLDDEPMHVPSISTGSLAVDRALGVGGVPRSRVTEIFGPEGGGKTTLAQHIVAEAQKLGGTAVYIDMEHAVDLAYMAACGVDTSAVYFSQPDSGTDALNIVRKLVSSNTVDLIVVDSVAALTSVAELDADAGDQFMGVQARMMSQNLKTIVPSLGLSKTALVFINQTRIEIGGSESASQRIGESANQRVSKSASQRIGESASQRWIASGRQPRARSSGTRERISESANQQISKSANQQISESALDGEWQTAELDVEGGKGISRGREHRPRAREHQEIHGRAPGTDGHDPGGGPGPGGE